MNIPEQHALFLQQVMSGKNTSEVKHNPGGKKKKRTYVALSAQFKQITRSKTHEAPCPISDSTVCLSLSVLLHIQPPA